MSFEPINVVLQSKILAPSMSHESGLHYSRRELNAIALEAISIVRSKRQAAFNFALDIEAEDESLRGLEMVNCPARRVDKDLVRNGIIKYHRLLCARKDISTDKKHLLLAAAASKLSNRARLVSLETARIDSLRAFGADYLIPVVTKALDLTDSLQLKREKNFNSGNLLLTPRQEIRRVTVDIDENRPIKKRRADFSNMVYTV